jgi:hypothetical protein
MFSDRNFAHLSPDQVSFYDETLKKQIEGSYTDDGKENPCHAPSIRR